MAKKNQEYSYFEKQFPLAQKIAAKKKLKEQQLKSKIQHAILSIKKIPNSRSRIHKKIFITIRQYLFIF